jgi:hypothetical protein
MANIIDEGTKAIDDLLIVGVLVGGGVLAWKFWPELSTAADLTKKITDTTEELIGGTSNVLEDALSGDYYGATQELYQIPLIGKIAIGVDKLTGTYVDPPEPDYCGDIVKGDMKTYIPRMSELSKFNDWRPDQIQATIDSWIRKGTAGNLRQILQGHMNHLSYGVQGGKGSIVRLDIGSAIEGEPVGHEIGIGFKLALVTKDNALCYSTEYKVQHFLVGFAYYLQRALGNNWSFFSPENRQKMVTVLNDVKFKGNYSVASGTSGNPDSITMAELRLLEEYRIAVKNQGGTLVFSMKEIENPLMRPDGTIDWSLLVTD